MFLGLELRKWVIIIIHSMNRAHKIKLVPNKTQLVALKKAAGCARYAYNYGLATWKEQYELFKQGKAEKPDLYSISRMWTQHKPEWAYESPKDASAHSILNVGRAYANFWNRKAQLPKFKKKGQHDSFYLANDRVSTNGKLVTLSKIGTLRMRESLRFDGKIMSVVVSQDSGDWFVSIQVDLPDNPKSTNDSIVGVDVGIKSLAVASDGTVLDNPKLLKQQSEKLTRLNQKLSACSPRSNRQWKARLKLQKLHRRIRNSRQDAIHKFTSQLAKNHGKAVIETLDVQHMQQKETSNKWMRCLLADTTMKEAHRQLEYKMETVKAPSFYPSSKTCSHCGHLAATLPLSQRNYKCNACGFKCDRDLNAAYNLRNMRWVTPYKSKTVPFGEQSTISESESTVE